MGDRRRADRTKKRLACTLVIGDTRLAGIVLDLSASGIFVQTSANPAPGAELGLEIEIPGEPQRPLLAVRVARRKVVPPRLKSVVHGGLGLQIESAPEAYFRYLAQLQPDEAAAASPTVAASPAKPSLGVKAPPAKLSPARGRGALRGTPPRPAAVAKKERFRVRVSQIGGSRSRSLEVSAASEEEARREAMAAAGEGWKILGCERVAS
jgi:Tfp pilus assembly protein PilZ